MFGLDEVVANVVSGPQPSAAGRRSAEGQPWLSSERWTRTVRCRCDAVRATAVRDAPEGVHCWCGGDGAAIGAPMGLTISWHSGTVVPLTLVSDAPTPRQDRTSVPSIAMLGSRTVPPPLETDAAPVNDPHRLRYRNVHWDDGLHAYVTAVAREGEARGYTRAEFSLSAVAREAIRRLRTRHPDPAIAAHALIRGGRKTAPLPSRARSVWWDDDLHGWLEDVVREAKRAGNRAVNISVVVREALTRLRSRYPDPAKAAEAIIRGWERGA